MARHSELIALCLGCCAYLLIHSMMLSRGIYLLCSLNTILAFIQHMVVHQYICCMDCQSSMTFGPTDNIVLVCLQLIPDWLIYSVLWNRLIYSVLAIV